METFKNIAIYIFISTSIIALITMFLTYISTASAVRQLIDKFFVLFVAIPQMIRNGCAYVINKIITFLIEAARSTGISGEHKFQRIIGSVFLTLFAVVGVIVALMTTFITLLGVTGAKDSLLIESLPLPVEALMSFELVISAILLGILLLDVIGVTHLTKFYSSDCLSKISRYIFSVIFAIGLIYSIHLYTLSGNIRSIALTSDVDAHSGFKNSSDAAFLYSPNSKQHGVKDSSGFEVVQENDIPTDYKDSVRKLMVGISVLSSIAGTFSFMGIVTFLAALAQVVVFLPVIITFGSLWLLTQGLVNIINHIYNFIYSFLDIFIQFTESLKRRGRNDNNQPSIPPSSPGEGEQREVPANTNPNDQRENSSNDPNWNPLL